MTDKQMAKNQLENLIRLAKAAGKLINTDHGDDDNVFAWRRLCEEYENFCEWRHDYINTDFIDKLVEEVEKEKLASFEEYIDLKVHELHKDSLKGKFESGQFWGFKEVQGELQKLLKNN